MPDDAIIPKLPVRELPKPEERKALSKWEFATLFLAQMGKCKKCGERLEKGKTIDEHLQPLDALGSNDLSNRALYCRPCAAEKTSKLDRPRRDHGRKVRGEVGNGPKRQIQNRPFNSSGRKLEGGGSLSHKPDGYVSPLSKEYRRKVRERMER